MPNLSYTEADFIAFTKILSAAVNSKFSDLKTLLNTTKLDDTNLQNAGITRATKLKTGTANFVLINNGSGQMSEEAQLARSRGGTGLDLGTLTGEAGRGIVVNDAETALSFGTPSVDRITQELAGDIATLVAGEAISVNDAVCLDIHNGTGSNVYRVFQCDSDLANRRNNFLGFALNTATVTPGIYTWTDSAALVTSNVITWSINTRPYTQTFSTDNDTTLASIAVKIAADPDVQSAVVTDSGSNDRVITITAHGGLSLNIPTPVVTAGSSQATIAILNTQSAAGQAVRIRNFGPMTGMSGLTVSNLYYLSGTAGQITDSPSDTNPVQVGQALSSTELFVNRNVGAYQFGSTNIMVRAFGGSTGVTQANFQSNSEHFNYVSWSAGTSDSAIKGAMQCGESVLSSRLIAVDGVRASSVLADTRIYNKTSWSAGSARSTGRDSGGVGTLGGVLYVGKGTTTVAVAQASDQIDSYNGTSWSNGVGTLANAANVPSTFSQGGLVRWVGGSSVAGGTLNIHETFNAVSVGTDTAPGTAIYGDSGSRSQPGGIAYDQAGTACRSWNGSSWSSTVSLGHQTSNDIGQNNGAASGFSSTNALAYINGGASGSTTSITTTTRFNGTAFVADTASSTARAGAQGAIF